MSPSQHAFLLTRQSAPAFNQPLSFDTSSVTDMGSMFQVRSARAHAPVFIYQSGLHCTLLGLPPQRPPVSWPSMSLSRYASLWTRQLATAFNQPLSLDTSKVMNMQHMFTVRSARALALTLHSWVHPCPLLASPRPTPSRLPTSVLPSLQAPLFWLGRAQTLCPF